MNPSLQTKREWHNRNQTSYAANPFETIYTRYVKKVYQKCLFMTQNRSIAQDYTHDIFLKVFENIKSFENRSAFSTWLFSISHNYCIDKIKASRRINLECLSDNLGESLAEQDESGLLELRLQSLEKMINCLPGSELDLVRLKYEQGLSIKAIAQQHNLKESAVKMRLKRTRDKLNGMYNEPM
jgi:RNA polymerase sigma factor (sigma-70 family)